MTASSIAAQRRVGKRARRSFTPLKSIKAMASRPAMMGCLLGGSGDVQERSGAKPDFGVQRAGDGTGVEDGT
ncbi:MAG TPA: hypothetical protein VJ476_14025, partial [Rhizomicrobium sp.]|nr:hypothetical protein [Rhizomicrobium sp.]